MAQANTVEIKAKEKYRGNGYYFVEGEVAHVDKDVAKQLLKDFPDKFEEVAKKKAGRPKKAK